MRAGWQVAWVALLVTGALSGCVGGDETRPKSVLLSIRSIDLDLDRSDDAFSVYITGSANRRFLRFDGDLSIAIDEIVPATDCLPEERRPMGTARFDVRESQFFRAAPFSPGPGSTGLSEPSDGSNLLVYEELLPMQFFPREGEYEFNATLDVGGGREFTRTVRADNEEGGPPARLSPRDSTRQVEGVHVELSYDAPELHIFGYSGSFDYASNCPFDADVEVHVTREAWTPNGTVDEDRGTFAFSVSYQEFGSIGGNSGLGVVHPLPPNLAQEGGTFRFDLTATLADGRVLTAQDDGWI